MQNKRHKIEDDDDQRSVLVLVRPGIWVLGEASEPGSAPDNKDQGETQILLFSCSSDVRFSKINQSRFSIAQSGTSLVTPMGSSALLPRTASASLPCYPGYSTYSAASQNVTALVS